MDKPTGDDNFLTLDELLEHWDVSKKTLRRQIKRLSHHEREDFVRKVPIGQELTGEDGKEHFYYTLGREFWMNRMARHYPRRRKLSPSPESLDTGKETGGQGEASRVDTGGGQRVPTGSQSVQTEPKLIEELKRDLRVAQRNDSVAQRLVNHLEDQLNKQGDRFERMQNADRDRYLDALEKKDFLISGLHQEIGELKALQAPKSAEPEEVKPLDTGDGQSSDSSTPTENTAQQSNESDGQESE